MTAHSFEHRASPLERELEPERADEVVPPPPVDDRELDLERRERRLEQMLEAIEAQRERLVAVREEYERRREELMERARELELARNRLRAREAELAVQEAQTGNGSSGSAPDAPRLRAEDAVWWSQQLGGPGPFGAG